MLSVASSTACSAISASNLACLFSKTSFPVEYNASYCPSNALENCNNSESSLLYATYSNSAISSESTARPLHPSGYKT